MEGVDRPVQLVTAGRKLAAALEAKLDESNPAAERRPMAADIGHFNQERQVIP